MPLFKISLPGGKSRKGAETEQLNKGDLPPSPPASTSTFSKTSSSYTTVDPPLHFASSHASEPAPPPFASGEARLSCVVVGAGFAGLSAAIALSRQGYSVTVLEKSSGPSKHGDCLTIGSNAAKILRRWGPDLFPEAWSLSAKGGAWLLKSAEGNSVRTEDLRDFPALYGAPLLQAHRGQLLGLLGVEARLNLVTMRLGTEVLRYIDSGQSPGVVIKSGEHEETLFADVVIVADGINSRGRELILSSSSGPILPSQRSPSSRFSVHRGLTSSKAISANSSVSYLLDGCTRTWIGEDCHLNMTALDQGRQISFSFVHLDLKGTASTHWQDRRNGSEVLDLLPDWDPDLVAAVKTFSSVLHWKKTEEPAADRWVSRGGKIILIGDAVHPLPPSSFQGGSQSIEDGAALAICLALSGGSRNDVPRALRAFEQLRKPRVAEALETGKQQRHLWHSWRSTGRLASHLDLLIAKGYSHDAELDTLARFERAVQQGDEPSWAMAEGRKKAVLARLNVGKESPMEGLFKGGKLPTK